MPLYPQEVQISKKLTEKLNKTYSLAYKNILNSIEGATDFGVANRRAILQQIEEELAKSGIIVDDLLTTEIEKAYRKGADEAVKQLKNNKAPVAVQSGFNVIHKEAISALVDDTSRSFAESIQGVNRNANILIGKATRDALTQKLAEGVLSGESKDRIRQQLKGLLQEQGLVSIIDKAGRAWTLDRYTEMLLRTRIVEARNRGLANRMVENGYDLVQVSNHFSTHHECAVWEGKILSLRGEVGGYPTVAEAESAGLFHPNCKHAINALIPSLARKTKAYDPSTETYVIDDGKYAKAQLNSFLKQQSGSTNALDFQIKTDSAVRKTFGFDTGRFKGVPVKPLPQDKLALQPLADFANRFDTATEFQRFVAITGNSSDATKAVKDFGYNSVGDFYKDAVAGRVRLDARNASINNFFEDLEKRVGVGVDIETANKFRKSEIMKDVEVKKMVKTFENLLSPKKSSLSRTFTLYRGEGGLNPSSGLDAYGKGKYYTFDKDFAKTYGKVTKSEVTLNNPVVFNTQKELEQATNSMIDGGFNDLGSWAKKQGYDSIVDMVSDTVLKL